MLELEEAEGLVAELSKQLQELEARGGAASRQPLHKMKSGVYTTKRNLVPPPPGPPEAFNLEEEAAAPPEG